MSKTVSGTSSGAPESRRFERCVYLANAALYLGWHSIVVAKAGTFAATMAAFFRESKGAMAGLGKAGLACSLLGSVAAVGEAAITAVVFARTAWKCYKLEGKCDRHAEAHQKLTTYSKQEKRRCRGAPSEIVELPDDCGRRYAKYQTASGQLQSVASEFISTSVVFARDTVLQGTGAGANLASLWTAFKVSDLLHLGKCVVDVGAAAIVSGAAGIAGAMFQIVGGALAVVRGNRALQRTAERLKTVGDQIEARNADSADVANAADAFARSRVARNWGDNAKYEKLLERSTESDFSQAIAISRQLLRQAKRGEERAMESAQHQVRLGKLRIGYGIVGGLVGGAALAVALTIGAATPIGWAIAGVGALMSAGWLFYAWRRNRQYARTLQKLERMAQAEAGSIEQLLHNALQAVERQGTLTDPLSCKLIKQTLLDLGVTRKEFRVLKFCRAEDKSHVRAAMETKIKKCIGVATAA